jgi:FtsP/CotA-like multicopper oxidase with cupredoxin domain
MRLRLVGLMCALGLLWPVSASARQTPITPSGSAVRPLAAANDNRTPAGSLASGVLTLRLVAEQAHWRPEGATGRVLSIQAFREERGSLTVPGPLVRVPAGTEIHVSIRNALPGATLKVFGMQPRPAASAEVLQVPAGETRDVTFTAGAPGSYHYWATTTDGPLAVRRDVDSQLGGAFIVDPPGPRPVDRVLVMTMWSRAATPTTDAVDIAAFNGRSWPETERFDARVGDAVRWRVINQTTAPHAMHLHGMYFTVISNGDASASRAYPDAERPFVVTEQVVPGETFEMEWTPERAGNWLFHCHMLVHMMPDEGSPQAAHQHVMDASGGMAGLVAGIRVAGSTTKPIASPTARRVTMRMREEPNRYGDAPGYRIDVEGVETSRLSSGPTPGPTLLLTRGEPVAVELVNEMRAATAIHWHGIELDSYFDGVPGWGGTVGSTTPAIAPGQRFTAAFTPPRAGTFIYHTHWHDEGQLSGGLYGALIVLEPGQRFDPATDHIFIAAYEGPSVAGQREPVVVNGRAATVPAMGPGPTATPFRQGVSNRIRLINITPNNVALTFVLTDGFKPLTWKAIAKDGADLPVAQRTSREARQLVTVGETYDFEIQPTPGQRLWLELRRGNGEWVAQTLIVAEP